jgi:hypothetical protein
MSEGAVLRLFAQYPHPTALARRVRDASLFPALRRLEAHGFLWRQRGVYFLT